ncbi:hypothetical protein CT154_07155 [Komagataeibacter xylinus]|nr:hypothetical protein CT154_07155 [Komagataeibacter xylinus]
MTRRSPIAMTAGATCQWIEGSVRHGARPAFCGRPACVNRVWCGEHAALVFRTPSAAERAAIEKDGVSA